jgi:hypothetical protein
VAEEANVVRTVAEGWNAILGHELGIRLETRDGRDATPLLGMRPQELINRQLVDECQILVGVFWTRLGTPTGVAESGTVEEIERFVRSGRPALLYFSNCPTSPSQIDPDEYKRVLDYKNRCRSKGLYREYGTVSELGELLQRHISSVVYALMHGTAAP